MKFIFNPLSGQPTPVLNKAAEISYNPSGSGLVATTTQAAITEVQANVAAIPTPLTYKGTWNATTNTPTLANTDTGKAGWLYQVQVAGTQNFGAGAISFDVGDKVVNDGTIWSKWDLTDAVTSVNGATGAVTVNAINQLTGDITAGPASGSQSQAATLATVNSNVGAFGSATQVATITLDGKGRATAASNTAIQIAESQVTNLVSDLAGKQATGNYITALTGDVAASGPGSSAATLATVNSNVGTFTSATVTVDAKGRITAASNGSAATITANRAAVSDGSGAIIAATTTAAEIGFVNLTRSNLQAQIDGQAANNARNLNWITNYGIEVDTSGYATYADAAQVTPENGTGGSPNVTISRSTTTPLDGTADLNFVKDAANRQGQGFSYDFSIDRAYQGTQQSVAFNYEIVSGTYASGDVTVWLYDVTNGVLLSQPSGNSIISTSIPSQQGQCTFQTAINSTSYRLIFHVTTTSASAYTLAFDNVSVGPQVQASGGVDTAWAAYTPVFTGFGTAVSIDYKWRREGPDVLIEGQFTAGTTTATTAQITLPSGLTSASDYQTASVVGKGNIGAVSTTDFSTRAVLIGPSATLINIGTESSGTAGITPTNGNGVVATGGVLKLFARIRIAGWGSNTVLSTSANTRAVIFNGTQATQALTANVTNLTLTSAKDSVSGWSTNIYTVVVPGDYLVSGSAIVSGASALDVYKTGSHYGYFGAGPSAGASGGAVLVVNCIVGDTISIRSTQSVTATVGNISIALLQSSQQIAASESINARYFASATSISGSLATIVWTIKDYDTHNGMASGLYTVPAPGKYSVEADLALSGTFVLNNQNIIEVQKNSVATKNITKYLAAAVTNDNITIYDEINCATGDILRVQVSSGGTGPAIVSSNTRNVICIKRVGN